MKRFGLSMLGLVVVLAPAYGQTAEQRKATIEYLQALQTQDGGFLPARSKPGEETAAKPSLRATSSALRALKYFGGEPKDPAACGEFIRRCYDRTTGGFSDQVGGKPDIASTAIGIMAVIEAKLPADTFAPGVVKYLAANAKSFEDIRIAAAGLEAVKQHPKEADDWLAQIVKMRNADGSFGKGDGAARETGGATAAMLRLGAKLDQAATIIKTMKAGQRGDGGFGKANAKESDLESTYRVMRAFYMLKEKPDTDMLRGFLAKCRNDDGGYGVAPGQTSSVSGTYFAAIILHWLTEL
jgi:prenyltransferase beta subunit